MLPLENSPAAKRDRQGRVKASQYVEALYGVKAMESVRATTRKGRYRREGSYVYVPYVGGRQALAREMRAIGRGTIPLPGIYRKQASGYTMLFKQLERVPTVSKRYDFAYAAQDIVNKNLQAIFDKAFSDTLGRQNI
jgi:hypothetical protein